MSSNPPTPSAEDFENDSNISIIIDDADSSVSQLPVVEVTNSNQSYSSLSASAMPVKSHHGNLHASLSRNSNKIKVQSSLAMSIVVDDSMLNSDSSLEETSGDIDSILDPTQLLSLSAKLRKSSQSINEQSMFARRRSRSEDVPVQASQMMSLHPKDVSQMKGSSNMLTASFGGLNSSQYFVGATDDKNEMHDSRCSLAKSMTQKHAPSSEDYRILLDSLEQTQQTFSHGSKNTQSIVKEVEQAGYRALISHPVLSLYYLMHLVERRMYPLFFFINDVKEYRAYYHRSQTSHRQNNASKIFNSYLSQKSELPIQPCLPQYSINDELVVDSLIKQVHDQLSLADIDIFNELYLLCSKHLEIRCGKFQAHKLNDEVVMKRCDSFIYSAQWQCLKTDLNEDRLLTPTHVSRIIQRVLALPISVMSDFISKLSQYLDQLCFDWHQFPQAIKVLNEKPRRGRQRANSWSLIEVGRSFNNLTGAGDVTPATTQNVSEMYQAHKNHQFLKSKFKPDLYCQHCFNVTQDSEEKLHPFVCELCNYIAHKNCHGQVKIDCFAVQKSLEDLFDPQVTLLVRLTAAVDRFFALEQQIEGVSKATIDRKSASPEQTPRLMQKSSTKEKEVLVTATLQADRKLRYLEKERDVVQGAMAILTASLSIVDFDQAVQTISQRHLRFASLLDDMPNSAAVRVMIPAKLGIRQILTDSVKSVVVNYKKTAKEIVSELFTKAQIDEDPSKFQLLFEDLAAVERQLQDFDRPSVIVHLLNNSQFVLTARTSEANPLYADAILYSNIDQQLEEKRKAVIMEIFGTELQFTENFQTVISAIYDPMIKTGIVPKLVLNGIFGNLQDISELHAAILLSMKPKLAQDPLCSQNFVEQTLLPAFQDKKFAQAYIKYCQNQHSSQRALTKMSKESAEFAKALKDFESKSELGKLSLADILIQPMHRVTRYPILLKRLLQFTGPKHPDYKGVQQCLSIIETIAQKINDSVQQSEGAYRLEYIQANLDFSNHDHFNLNSDKRTLILEKPFSLISKKTASEALVLLFSDMILIVQISMKKDSEAYTLLKPAIPLSQSYIISNQNSVGAEISDTDDALKNSFQVVHFGIASYTLQAMSNSDRQSWIREALQVQLQFILSKHRQSLLHQIKTPFKLDNGVVSTLLKPNMPKIKAPLLQQSQQQQSRDSDRRNSASPAMLLDDAKSVVSVQSAESAGSSSTDSHVTIQNANLYKQGGIGNKVTSSKDKSQSSMGDYFRSKKQQIQKSSNA